MKNILLFIDSLVSGGAQRQLVGLAVLLKQRGYNVEVLAYYDIPFYLPYLQEHGVPFTLIKNGKGALRRFLGLRSAIRRFHADVVISYLDTPSIIASALHIFCRRWRLVVSERNTTQTLSRREKIKFWLYRFADAIVPNSNSQRRFIEAHYPRLSKKTYTIINFVDTDHFKPADIPRSKGEELRIIGVGRVTPQKNIKNLMQAAKMAHDAGCRNFSIDWYGKSDNEKYGTECESMMNELGIQDIFRFYAPDTDICRRYQEADVFCLPSVYEGFPNVLCEAMSCGLPVICSDVCDNPDLAVDGKSGYLFDPNSVEDIARAIKDICQLPAECRDRMATFNRNRAAVMLTEDIFADRYMQVIN